MKKIYINPGHSQRDPGAVGFETERDLNVAVAGYMDEYLNAHYAVQTRVNSGDSLYALCDEANAWGADLFVSIHFNAAGGDGYECYVYSDKTVPLGKLFEKQVLAVGQNSRGVKIRTNLAVLYRTEMPAILNEGAFVDNLKDIQDWNDAQELKTLAIAYAKAAAEYLQLEEKAPAEEAPAEEAPAPVWYRVQVGAYREKANAETMLKKIQAAGFADAYIKEGP